MFANVLAYIYEGPYHAVCEIVSNCLVQRNCSDVVIEGTPRVHFSIILPVTSRDSDGSGGSIYRFFSTGSRTRDVAVQREKSARNGNGKLTGEHFATG